MSIQASTSVDEDGAVRKRIIHEEPDTNKGFEEVNLESSATATPALPDSTFIWLLRNVIIYVSELRSGPYLPIYMAKGILSGGSYEESTASHTTESSATSYRNEINNASPERDSASLEGGTFSTADVYLVTSPLASTKPLGWFERFASGAFIFRILAGVNTSHWGLHIRSMYFDLKRDGGTSAFEATVEGLRSERDPVSFIPLGQTHFTEKELEQLGHHMITHHKDYGLFSENCQAFAVRNLAASALCPMCDQSCTKPEAPRPQPRGPTNAFYSMYTILCLRSEFISVPFMASFFAVGRRIFNLPWTFDPVPVFCLITLLVLSSIIIAMIPSSKKEQSYIQEINSTTLFDWELEHATSFSWDNDLGFFRSLSFGNKRFNCSDCARIATKRAILTRLCFQHHSHGQPRPSKISWLIPKVILSSPAWSGTVITSIVMNTLWQFSWQYWVVAMIAYQLLIAGVSLMLNRDLCKVGMGIKLLFAKSNFLLAWIGVLTTILFYGDIASSGDWPDLDRLGYLKYPICLVSLDMAAHYVFWYGISPRSLSKWIKPPSGGQIERSFKIFIKCYEYVWKACLKWYLRYHWWGCIAAAITLMCLSIDSVLSEKRATLIF